MAVKTTSKLIHNKKKTESNTYVLSKKRGGELLGQGSYGCVYSPPIPCDKTPNVHEGAVSKVMSMQNVFDEGRNAEKVVDDKYFLPLVMTCKTTKELIEKHKNTKKTCNVTVPDPFQLIYKYKGVDLEKYLKNPNGKELMPLKQMVPHLLNVAEGIQVLQTQTPPLAHTDIKPDNVLLANVKTGEKRMLLMDFGLLGNTTEIYDMKNENKLKHDSAHSPPELLLFYVLNYERPKANELYDKLFSKNAKFNTNNKKGFHYIPRNNIWENSIDKYKPKLVAFFTELYKFVDTVAEDKEKPKKLQDYFTEQFAKRMDVFQFGFVLHDVTKSYNPDDVMYEPKEGDLDRFKDLRTIVENTYHPNPYARWDIATVIKELKKIIKNPYSTVAKKPHSHLLSPPSATKSPSRIVSSRTISSSSMRTPPKARSQSVVKASYTKSAADGVSTVVDKNLFMNNRFLKTMVDMIVTKTKNIKIQKKK